MSKICQIHRLKLKFNGLPVLLPNDQTVSQLIPKIEHVFRQFTNRIHPAQCVSEQMGQTPGSIGMLLLLAFGLTGFVTRKSNVAVEALAQALTGLSDSDLKQGKFRIYIIETNNWRAI